MSAMTERLDGMIDRYNELSELMMSPEVLADNRRMAKLGKEQAAMTQAVETYQEYKKVVQGIEDANALMEEHDPEVKEMVKMELEELTPRKQELLDRLEILLIPKDPADQNNAIMEIRGAAGGDEGNIFAGDLFRMYSKYAESKGWKIEVLEAQESEAGGFTRIAFMMKGQEVYGHMKFESGSHRVQRVPKTETQGRVHTSTATVLVDPEIEADEIDIDPNDLEIDTMRASGAGGQHVNKTDSAVRVTHIPTGITVKCQDGRSQHANRETALTQIRSKVYSEMKRREEEERHAERKSKLGTGDRSEKIRTYNYPQNRVTDHRIGLTLQQLDRIMEGKLDDIIVALLEQDQQDKLAGNA
ncbi:peptide chain release factor 1 [Erysipelotrichaceae bacterium MTC7]|nr:peptide chain release factor 1 [Erysipelotrichaceae bacterium MTC7]